MAENKKVKKRIRSIAAAAAAMSLALSFAYAEEIGIDRAGFGTAVTVSAADTVLAVEYCGPYGAESAKATLYSDETGYGTLVISGNGQIDAENSLLKRYITNNSQYQDMINKIIIEDGITDIPQNCFFDCWALDGLQSVEIGKDVRSIGGGAFSLTSGNFKEVVFADNSSLETIGSRAFWGIGCNYFKKIKIPDSVTTIGNEAFYGCKALESVEFDVVNSKLESIGKEAFAECPNLKNLVIPNSVKTLGADWLSSVKGYIAYPKNLADSIPASAVKNAVSFEYTVEGNDVVLTGVENPGETVTVPDFITVIGESAFDSAVCRNVTNITLPDTITEIRDSAFSDCRSLKSITIPKKVTYIGPYVFNECTALSNVKFENGSNLNHIDEGAFRRCKALTSVDIPQNVTDIGEMTFEECTALSEVNFESGSKLNSIGRFAFYNCTALDSIVIPENATKIKASAFNSSGLKSVTIPNSVTEIGTAAFLGCKALSNVNFENGSKLSSIGELVFGYCTALESINIPENVTKIETSAFAYSGLKNVVVPKNVTVISDNAFGECTALESIFISKDISVNPAAVINTASKVLYEIKDSKAYITEITLGDGRSDVAIPETICGFPVVFVDENSRRYVGAHTHVAEKEICTEGKICGICGNSYTTPSGHDDSDSWKYDADNHWKICARVGCGEQIKLEAHTFDEGVVTTLPTEYSEGVRTYTCNTCGYEKTESIEKSDHTHKPSEKYAYDESEHWKTCTECNEKFDPEKHSFDEGVVTTEPTEYSEGVRTYTCAVCSYEKTESIEKLNHTHKPSEKYTYDETEHWKTCTECSEKLDPEKHSFDEGVVTTQPTTESEGVRTYICTVCGYEKTESIEKLPEEPIKTYPIVISGDVSVSKSGASAGETVDVSAPFGYDIIVTDGSGRQIAKMTDKDSFIMPASGVRITAVRGEIFAHMTNAWSHSYVYSYDGDMNRIKVNSDVKRGVVTIDLGVNYAGRSFTVYSGRKSTSRKITEGALDENGRYTFSSDDGRNYTLVLD